MKVHVLDDWSDTLRHLPSFSRLSGRDVTVWTDNAEGPALIDCLQEAEAICQFQERTKVTDALLAGWTKPLRGIGACGWRSAPNEALLFV